VPCPNMEELSFGPVLKVIVRISAVDDSKL
jgi:hypothetical protein